MNKGLSSFTIFGSGNVAHSLVPAFLQAGYKIDQIISRKESSAKALAEKHQLKWSDRMVNIQSDYVLISVSDDAIENIASRLHVNPETIVMHTAGSVSIDILEKHHENSGILYPLQTFSKSRTVNINELPLCIEATNEDTEKKIIEIAGQLSAHVYKLNSDERKIAHLSAVFVCNFVNLMYTTGYDIMQQNKLSFDILRPLILETARKAIDENPDKLQTGPALRGDNSTLQKHMSMLDENMAELYNFLSQSIKNRYH